MPLSLKDAEAFMPKDLLKALKKQLKDDKDRFKTRTGFESVDRTQSNAARDRDTTNEKSPQRILYRAIEKARPGTAEYNRKQLIPGRRFEADIYLPQSKIVIELDGYGYHKSKDAFRSDREKSNLFLELGMPTLRYVNAHVQDDIENTVEQILRIHDLYIKVNEALVRPSTT